MVKHEKYKLNKLWTHWGGHHPGQLEDVQRSHANALNSAFISILVVLSHDVTCCTILSLSYISLSSYYHMLLLAATRNYILSHSVTCCNMLSHSSHTVICCCLLPHEATFCHTLSLTVQCCPMLSHAVTNCHIFKDSPKNTTITVIQWKISINPYIIFFLFYVAIFHISLLRTDFVCLLSSPIFFWTLLVLWCCCLQKSWQG